MYAQKNDDLDPVGASNNLRGLAAKIEIIDRTLSQNLSAVKQEKQSRNEAIKKAEIYAGAHPVSRGKIPTDSAEYSVADVLGKSISEVETYDMLHALSGKQKIATGRTQSPREFTLPRLLRSTYQFFSILSMLLAKAHCFERLTMEFIVDTLR